MKPSTTETEQKITVVLVSKAAADLERTRCRSKLTKTDAVNRAISLYEFLDEELASGTEVLLHRRDGSTYLFELH